MTNQAKISKVGIWSSNWDQVEAQADPILRRYPTYDGWFLRIDHSEAQHNTILLLRHQAESELNKCLDIPLSFPHELSGRHDVRRTEQ